MPPTGIPCDLTANRPQPKADLTSNNLTNTFADNETSRLTLGIKKEPNTLCTPEYEKFHKEYELSTSFSPCIEKNKTLAKECFNSLSAFADNLVVTIKDKDGFFCCPVCNQKFCDIKEATVHFFSTHMTDVKYWSKHFELTNAVKKESIQCAESQIQNDVFVPSDYQDLKSLDNVKEHKSGITHFRNNQISMPSSEQPSTLSKTMSNSELTMVRDSTSAYSHHLETKVEPTLSNDFLPHDLPSEQKTANTDSSSIGAAVYLSNAKSHGIEPWAPGNNWRCIPLAYRDYTYEPTASELEILLSCKTSDFSICPYCSVILSSVSDAAEHAALHTNNKPYVCRHCKYSCYRTYTYSIMCNHFSFYHQQSQSNRHVLPTYKARAGVSQNRNQLLKFHPYKSSKTIPPNFPDHRPDSHQLIQTNQQTLDSSKDCQARVKGVPYQSHTLDQPFMSSQMSSEICIESHQRNRSSDSLMARPTETLNTKLTEQSNQSRNQNLKCHLYLPSKKKSKSYASQEGHASQAFLSSSASSLRRNISSKDQSTTNAELIQKKMKFVYKLLENSFKQNLSATKQKVLPFSSTNQTTCHQDFRTASPKPISAFECQSVLGPSRNPSVKGQPNSKPISSASECRPFLVHNGNQSSHVDHNGNQSSHVGHNGNQSFTGQPSSKPTITSTEYRPVIVCRGTRPPVSGGHGNQDSVEIVRGNPLLDSLLSAELEKSGNVVKKQSETVLKQRRDQSNVLVSIQQHQAVDHVPQEVEVNNQYGAVRLGIQNNDERQPHSTDIHVATPVTTTNTSSNPDPQSHLQQRPCHHTSLSLHGNSHSPNSDIQTLKSSQSLNNIPGSKLVLVNDDGNISNVELVSPEYEAALCRRIHPPEPPEVDLRTDNQSQHEADTTKATGTCMSLVDEDAGVSDVELVSLEYEAAQYGKRPPASVVPELEVSQYQKAIPKSTGVYCPNQTDEQVEDKMLYHQITNGKGPKMCNEQLKDFAQYSPPDQRKEAFPVITNVVSLNPDKRKEVLPLITNVVSLNQDKRKEVLPMITNVVSLNPDKRKEMFPMITNVVSLNPEVKDGINLQGEFVNCV